MTGTVNVVIPGAVVPAVRIGRERYTDRAKRYLGWQDEFRVLLIAALRAEAGYTGPLPVFGAGVAVAASYTFQRARQRGDVTNMVKAAEDAANGILWADDAQVSSLTAIRVRCAKGEDATGITVRALDGARGMGASEV